LFSPELIRHPSRKTAICPAIQATYRPATVQPSSQPRLRPTAQPAGPPHYRVRIELSPVKQCWSSATTSPIQFIQLSSFRLAALL
jgi:hypothetical protein